MIYRSLMAVVTGVALGVSAGAVRGEEQKVVFDKDVKPILVESCLKCHGGDPAKKPKGKLDLRTKESAMKGGASGKAIVPGKAEESLFYKLLLGPVSAGGDEIDRMPQKKDALPPAKIATIKAWIDQGAPWPEGDALK